MGTIHHLEAQGPHTPQKKLILTEAIRVPLRPAIAIVERCSVPLTLPVQSLPFPPPIIPFLFVDLSHYPCLTLFSPALPNNASPNFCVTHVMCIDRPYWPLSHNLLPNCNKRKIKCTIMKRTLKEIYHLCNFTKILLFIKCGFIPQREGFILKAWSWMLSKDSRTSYHVLVNPCFFSRAKECWKGRESVKKILNGGGSLSVDLIKDASTIFPKARILSAYGKHHFCTPVHRCYISFWSRTQLYWTEGKGLKIVLLYQVLEIPCSRITYLRVL